MKKSKSEIAFGMCMWLFILGIIFFVAALLTPKTSPSFVGALKVGAVLIIISILILFYARHLFRKEHKDES